MYWARDMRQRLLYGNINAGPSAWEPGASPSPAPTRAGSSGGTGSRPRSMVRFASAEASPAITPSWKSNSWAAPTAARLGKGDPGARSPDLKADMGELLNEEEMKVNEQQMDRDWYDR